MLHGIVINCLALKDTENNAWLLNVATLTILGLAVDTSMACVQLLFIRGGRLLGRENYFVQHDGDSSETIMTDFIKQYYGDTNFILKSCYYLWKLQIETY